MKQKFLNLVMGLAIVVGMTSCVTTKMTTSPIYSLSDSRVTNGKLVTVLDTKGELEAEISGKFSMTNKIKKIVGMPKMQYVIDGAWSSWRQSRGVTAAKAAVLYKALEDSGCDIVLAPIYNVTLHKRKFNIKVKGIGAKIVDVEQHTECIIDNNQ